VLEDDRNMVWLTVDKTESAHVKIASPDNADSGDGVEMLKLDRVGLAGVLVRIEGNRLSGILLADTEEILNDHQNSSVVLNSGRRRQFGGRTRASGKIVLSTGNRKRGWPDECHCPILRIVADRLVS